MWARNSLAAAANWNGELAGEALVVNHADITGFKTNTATLTFWMYENGASPAYSPLVHLANTSSFSTGDFRMSRNGTSSDQQNYVYTGYEAGANGASARQCPTGQWNLWTVRLGAGGWRVLGNAATQLSSSTWVSASFAGNTRPLSLASNENIASHTDEVYSSFRGRFGDVRLWNISLSDVQVTALHTAGRQSY
jgi:ribosome modulation factor